jgi:glyoxylase I family protein
MCSSTISLIDNQERMNGRIKKSLLMLVLLERITGNNTFALFGPLPQNQYCHHCRTTVSSLSSNNVQNHASTLTKSSITRPFQLERIDHIVIRCHNFPAMFDFYTRILGCTIDEPINDHVNRFGGALTHLRAGACYIDLLAYDAKHLTEEGKQFAARSYAGGTGIGENSSVDDLCFSADSSTLDHLCIRIEPFDEQRIKTYLMGESVTIVAAGEGRLGADGVGPSIYIRDPEGNVIELKGKPTLVNNSGDNDNNSARKKIIDTSTDITQSPVADKENNNHGRQSNDYGERSSADVGSEEDKIPITPCNRICRYNNSFYSGQVCIGCFREEYEIKMWQSMTASEKSVTLLDQIDRCTDAEESNISYDGAVTVEELTKQYNYWAVLAKESK